MPRKPRTVDASALTYEAVFPEPRPRDLLALIHEAQGTREPTRAEWEAVPLTTRARLVRERDAEEAEALREQERANQELEQRLQGEAKPEPEPETPTDEAWRL